MVIWLLTTEEKGIRQKEVLKKRYLPICTGLIMNTIPNVEHAQNMDTVKRICLNCFYSSFLTWCIILLEVAIRGWVHGGHKGMDVIRNNAQVGLGI